MEYKYHCCLHFEHSRKPFTQNTFLYYTVLLFHSVFFFYKHALDGHVWPLHLCLASFARHCTWHNVLNCGALVKTNLTLRNTSRTCVYFHSTAPHLVFLQCKHSNFGFLNINPKLKESWFKFMKCMLKNNNQRAHPKGGLHSSHSDCS